MEFNLPGDQAREIFGKESALGLRIHQCGNPECRFLMDFVVSKPAMEEISGELVAVLPLRSQEMLGIAEALVRHVRKVFEAV